MKRFLTLFLVLAMIVVAASACTSTPGNGSDTTTPGGNTDTTPGNTTTGNTDTTAPDENLNTAETLVAYLKKLVAENPNAGAKEIAKLYLKHELLANVALEVDSQNYPTGHDPYVAGLKSDFKIPKFKSVTQIAPMMMPSTFITNIFVLDKSTDAEDYANQILANSNPAWNVCVVVDEVAVGHAGNMVFQVMTDSLEPETMEDTTDSVLEYTLDAANIDTYTVPFTLSSSKGFEYSGVKDNTSAVENDATMATADNVSVRVLKLTDTSKAEAVMNEMKTNLTAPEGSVVMTATQGSYVLAVVAANDVCQAVVDAFKTLVAENL